MECCLPVPDHVCLLTAFYASTLIIKVHAVLHSSVFSCNNLKGEVRIDESQMSDQTLRPEAGYGQLAFDCFLLVRLTSFYGLFLLSLLAYSVSWRANTIQIRRKTGTLPQGFHPQQQRNGPRSRAATSP